MQVTLEVTYSFEFESWRDDGSRDRGSYSSTIGANQVLEIDSYYDDGYGNGERTQSTLIQFVIKVNGTIIYDAADFPDNGGIYNNYQINITNING